MLLIHYCSPGGSKRVLETASIKSPKIILKLIPQNLKAFNSPAYTALALLEIMDAKLGYYLTLCK
jgi:hypothetical protein